jgi:hypothetical protein
MSHRSAYRIRNAELCSARGLEQPFMGTTLIRSCFRFVVAAFCLLTMACLAGRASCASETSYVFHGRFTPTDRQPSTETAPASPGELMGRPFTARISWPTSPDHYSSDWQTGTNHWGSYTSEAISIQLEVPSIEFVVEPSITQWETFNDTPLDYHQGTALTSGDELRLIGRADWTQTIVFESHFGDETRQESFTSVTEYMMTLRASDYDGALLDDDSLQTQFDLTAFDNVRFEFQQIVPVAGDDPRPIRMQHFLGTVDSIVVVPEPVGFGIGFIAVLGAAVLRRRYR